MKNVAVEPFVVNQGRRVRSIQDAVKASTVFRDTFCAMGPSTAECSVTRTSQTTSASILELVRNRIKLWLCIVFCFMGRHLNFHIWLHIQIGRGALDT